MRGSSDESPFYVSKKEQEMSMEIYLITAGALFLFYYGILCFYTGKWDSTFARFWLVAGIGHFLMIPATKEEVKAFVLLCGGNMDPFSCGGVFYCTCHEAWKKEELPVSDRAWCAGPGRADHRFIKEKTGCCFIVSSGLSFGEDHRIRRSGKR